MKVTVRFFPSLRRITHADELEVELRDEAGLNDLMQELSNRFGRRFLEALYISELGVSNPYTSVIVDGETVLLTKSRNSKLKDGSVVVLLSPLGGG